MNESTLQDEKGIFFDEHEKILGETNDPLFPTNHKNHLTISY